MEIEGRLRYGTEAAMHSALQLHRVSARRSIAKRAPETANSSHAGVAIAPRKGQHPTKMRAMSRFVQPVSRYVPSTRSSGSSARSNGVGEPLLATTSSLRTTLPLIQLASIKVMAPR